MNSNTIHIVVFGVGLKCPCKIQLNTQCPPNFRKLLTPLFNIRNLQWSSFTEGWLLSRCKRTIGMSKKLVGTSWYCRQIPSNFSRKINQLAGQSIFYTFKLQLYLLLALMPLIFLGNLSTCPNQHLNCSTGPSKGIFSMEIIYFYQRHN